MSLILCPAPVEDNSALFVLNRWKPNYVQHYNNSNCECFVGYKCCNTTCQPLTVSVDSCWEGNNKGIKFGIIEKNCCDCDVVRCLPCNSTRPEDQICPRGHGARPSDCYRYEQHQTYSNDERQCWLSGCTELASDAKNKTCLSECQVEVEYPTYCQFPEIDCENTKVKKDCPNKDIETALAQLTKRNQCYEEPEQVDDLANGHFYDYDTNACQKCQKWSFKEKSCETKNAFASLYDCHQHGQHQMDKKCFEKEILKDDCGCDSAECSLVDSQAEPMVFPADEVCPKDHVKISGVSICMKKRDVCKKCPPQVKIDQNECPNGKVVLERDINGCQVYRCERAQVPSVVCPCNTYILDKEANILKCLCHELSTLFNESDDLPTLVNRSDSLSNFGPFG